MFNLLYKHQFKKKIKNKKHFSVIYVSLRLSNGDLFNCEDNMFSFKCEDILFLTKVHPVFYYWLHDKYS